MAVTEQRVKAFMAQGAEGQSQPTAVEQAGLSERTGRRLDMMAVAVIDRLIHHAHVIEISGETYRKKTHTQRPQEATHKPRHRRKSSHTDRPNQLTPTGQNN